MHRQGGEKDLGSFVNEHLSVGVILAAAPLGAAVPLAVSFVCGGLLHRSELLY